jgi:hypothetical protein
MSDVVRVELPARLAQNLTGDGFDEFVIFRGLGTDVHAMFAGDPVDHSGLPRAPELPEPALG